MIQSSIFGDALLYKFIPTPFKALLFSIIKSLSVGLTAPFIYIPPPEVPFPPTFPFPFVRVNPANTVLT